MSATLLLALVFSAAPSRAMPAALPRGGAELELAVNEALRRWSKPSQAETATAAWELLALYQEVQQAQRQRGERMPAQSAQLAIRLKELSGRLAGQVAQQKGAVGRSAGGSTARPGHRELHTRQAGRGPAQVAGVGAGRGAGPPAAAVPLLPGQIATQAAVSSNAQELIDLIQATIAPRSWASQGGPGAIVYWRPSHAIVAAQSEEAHEQMADLLEQLRRAGQ